MKTYKINILLLFIVSTINIAQEVEPEITLERKKLIILFGEDENTEITDKISQIVSSVATQLKRYDVIDRNQIEKILHKKWTRFHGPFFILDFKICQMTTHLFS